MEWWMLEVEINELWPFVVSEIGASDLAVGGCRESETDVVDLLVVGVVSIDVGDLVGVSVLVWTVGILLVLESAGLVGALAVDVPNGAVGGSRESERSLLEILLVGELRRDVEDIVGIVVVCWCSIFG
jgi:hypothetical protein